MNREFDRRLALKCASILSVLLLLPMGVQAHEPESGPENDLYATMVWVVDTSKMRGMIGQGLPIELPLGGGDIAIVKVKEFDSISGPKVKYILNDDGEIVGTEPLIYWSFEGSVVGESASEVFLAMDDRGLYGHVIINGAVTDFKPVNEDHVLAPGEDAEIEVRWIDRGGAISALNETTNGFETIPQSASGLLNSVDDGVGGEMSASTACKTATVRPYSDYSFRYYKSNWETRILNAINAGRTMYLQQACLVLDIQSPYPSNNWSTSTNCDTNLDDFRAYHGRFSGVDGYQGFTGRNLSGCYGNGYTSFYGSGHFVKAGYEDTIIEAIDWSSSDDYDPDYTHDLGIVSNHELAHIWGQKEHEFMRRSMDWTYNIMAGGVDFDQREYWLTPNARQNIMDAWANRS